MSKIILMGESEIVNINIASGIPNAKNAQPKNSATVIIAYFPLISVLNTVKLIYIEN